MRQVEELKKIYWNKPFQRAQIFQKAYLTDMIQELIDSNIKIEPILISGQWCEIDTMQDLKNAENDYMIIKRGSASSGSAANTSIIAQMSGTILEIPVKEGDQVIQSNNFNAGTTIASIADMNKMIFEGKVDESEVGKLINGTAIEISLGAIEGKKFPANLNFIAPKGTEEAGAVQFKIKADVALDENYFIRAGYSANAEIVLEKKDSVMSIKESLLQFDRKTEKPFVEIKNAEGKFDKKFIELGTSDGVNVEIIKGLTMEDEIKVWNKKTEKDDEDQFNE